MPQIKTEVSIGQIAQIFTMVASVGSFVWYQSNIQTETKRDIMGLSERIARLEPLVSTNNSADSIQNERMQNLAASNLEYRALVSRVMQQLGDLRQDVAVLKTSWTFLERQGKLPAGASGGMTRGQ